MFTGLVETTGSVLSVQPKTGGATRLEIVAPALTGKWRQGDSIAVNGVCLTAIPVSQPDRFAADLAQETLARTTLAGLQSGSVVNLELPTPAGAPLGGHVVQGHVDGVGTLTSLQALGPDFQTTDWRLSIEIPASLAAHVVQQGSITVDGISLTVAKLYPPQPSGTTRLEIAIIPHTYRSTNLRALVPGSAVNIETDVLARYAERRGEQASPAEPPTQAAPLWLTAEYLLANGY